MKMYSPGRASYDSLASIDRFLTTIPMRLMDAGEFASNTIDRVYKVDDWDLLMVEDEQDIHNIVVRDYSTFSCFPIIRQQNASGVSIGGRVLMGAAHACREVADMLVATEIWTISHFHRDLLLRHYEKFFSSDIVGELRDKMRVLYLGIEVPKIHAPRRVRDSLRIFFPHRVSRDKGVDLFLEYLRALRDADPHLTVTPIMRIGRNNAYREIARDFAVVTIPWLSREEYLQLASSCDIVFSSAKHENFGLAVMESVAMGCYPVLIRDLAYPELYPKSVLFDTVEEAVSITLGAIGKEFDNSFTQDYLWEARADAWRSELVRVYSEFYEDVHVTETGERIISELQESPKTKEEILKFLGWGQLLGWGKYRHMIRSRLPITTGPNPVYGTAIKEDRVSTTVPKAVKGVLF